MSDHQPGLWIVVGLGNPGPTYAATRHNVGAMVLDQLAETLGGNYSVNKRARADVVETRLVIGSTVRVVLAKPRSFMNESGGPVAGLLKYYGAESSSLVVIHDELDLPFDVLRLKSGGGDNGHNGLRSIRQSLGTGEFSRVRVGIGRPPGRQDAADFVLKPFSTTELKVLPNFLATAADACQALINDGLEAAQNQFNG